jgi:rhodanese-related sulfurtransferase
LNYTFAIHQIKGVLDLSSNIPDAALLRRYSPFDAISDSTLQEVISNTQLVAMASGKMLYKRQAERANCHWLVSGCLDLVDADYQTSQLQADSDNVKFMLDDQGHYQRTAVAVEDCLLIETDQNTLDLALTFDQTREHNHEAAGAEDDETENDETDDDWMTRMLSSRVFATIPPANIAALFQRFKPLVSSKGSIIIQQGDAGDFFYVVKDGSLSVDREVDGKTEHLAVLKAGALFGEEALFNDAPRNATITMLSNGTLMKLAKPDFTELLAEPSCEYVTQAEINEVIAAGEQTVGLIDVRFAQEFAGSAMPGAVNIPLQGLREAMSQLDKTAVYVVVTSGRRGELAAFLLNQAGFDTFVLQ